MRHAGTWQGVGDLRRCGDEATLEITAGTIRNETVTFLQNVSVSLRKSSSVSVS